MGGRTAIVVVAGVGDEKDGLGAELIAEGLVRHEGYGRMSEALEYFPVTGDVADRRLFGHSRGPLSPPA